MSLRLSFLCALFATGICPLIAQQVPASAPVTVNLLSNRVPLGEISQFIVKVTNGEATLPQTLDAPGLEISFSGSQSSITVVNGVSKIENNYYYRFRGNTPGTFKIPSFDVLVKGVAYPTREVEVTIYEKSQKDSDLDATKPLFGKLELSKESFYVNEIVPFSLTAYVRGRNSIAGVNNAKIENESFVFESFRDIRTDGAEVGNSFYTSASLPSTLFALKPGSHLLGPAQIGLRVMDTDSGFGLSAFFRSQTTQELTTNSINVEVKPLPDSAPVSFTGGVGAFEMATKASTTSVGVGDPISMEFEITGIGNLRTMSAPVFEIPQTGIWKSYPANKELDDASDSDGINPGKAKFSQVVIPETKTAVIPPFLLTYFDPQKDKYVTLRSEPIPITLTDDRPKNAGTAIQFSGEDNFPGKLPAAKPPTAEFNDILHIRTGPSRWVANAGGSAPGTFFYIIQVLFSIAFCTILGFGLVRWWNRFAEYRAGRAQNLTFARAVKNLPQVGSPRKEFFHAVLEALDLWKKEHPDAPEKVTHVIAQVSEVCATILYSGMAENDVPVPAAEVSKFEAMLNKLPRH